MNNQDKFANVNFDRKLVAMVYVKYDGLSKFNT